MIYETHNVRKKAPKDSLIHLRSEYKTSNLVTNKSHQIKEGWIRFEHSLNLSEICLLIMNLLIDMYGKIFILKFYLIHSM